MVVIKKIYKLLTVDPHFAHPATLSRYLTSL